MKNIFEITETPTLENTTTIEKQALKIKAKKQTTTLGKKNILKIMVNGKPYYHFLKDSFNSELVNRNNIILRGKRYYEGIINNSMHSKSKLTSLVS
jgi:hypothetical protein